MTPAIVGKPNAPCSRSPCTLWALNPTQPSCRRPLRDRHRGHPLGLQTVGVLTGISTAALFCRRHPPPDAVVDDPAGVAWVVFGAGT
ncbi:MAG: hypothetical protein R2854_18855 [Caldilineaceae bacterium]